MSGCSKDSRSQIITLVINSKHTVEIFPRKIILRRSVFFGEFTLTGPPIPRLHALVTRNPWQLASRMSNKSGRKPESFDRRGCRNNWFQISFWEQTRHMRMSPIFTHIPKEDLGMAFEGEEHVWSSYHPVFPNPCMFVNVLDLIWLIANKFNYSIAGYEIKLFILKGQGAAISLEPCTQIFTFHF